MATMRPDITIEVFSCRDLDDHLKALAALLHANVHHGASIGFILPYGLADSRAYWRQQVRPALRAGQRILLAATLGDDVVGTGQLNIAMPGNQTHRAEVMKLMVHPDRRRLGIGQGLMAALETAARQLGRSLLTLDTAGDAAEGLYRLQGFTVAGVIPGYARAATKGRLEATTFMYKQL
jgi:ribosomal protein S18 acetylase RimI-like enzyme